MFPTCTEEDDDEGSLDCHLCSRRIASFGLGVGDNGEVSGLLESVKNSLLVPISSLCSLPLLLLVVVVVRAVVSL